jgi:hypothetical protein
MPAPIHNHTPNKSLRFAILYVNKLTGSRRIGSSHVKLERARAMAQTEAASLPGGAWDLYVVRLKAPGRYIGFLHPRFDEFEILEGPFSGEV